MFSPLLKLIKRHSLKTPLEDFTTEIFTGLLKADTELKHLFCEKYLKMDSPYFHIYTQKKYYLEGKADCIIDVVIEGENEICFIENKVNSGEGFEQLARYCLILDRKKKEGYKTKLIYCTKRHEKKPNKQHGFRHIKWYNIADFLRKNSTTKLTKLFLDFLEEHKIIHNMKIESGSLVGLEYFGKVLNFMQQHMKRVKPDFERKFGQYGKISVNPRSDWQALEHERYCMVSSDVLSGAGYSEILTAFSFKGYIYTQIYVSKAQAQYKVFKTFVNDDVTVNYEDEHGVSLSWTKNLGEYLNQEDSEEEIKKWFTDSFDKVKSFIDETEGRLKWGNQE